MNFRRNSDVFLPFFKIHFEKFGCKKESGTFKKDIADILIYWNFINFIFLNTFLCTCRIFYILNFEFANILWSLSIFFICCH